MVVVGFHEIPAKGRNLYTSVCVEKGSVIRFCGQTQISNGCIIHVGNGAELSLDNNFCMSPASTIDCNKGITFGCNVLIGYDCLLIDSDGHTIYTDPDVVANEPKHIVIGNNVWLANDVKVLKGTIIPNNCVVGAGSIMNGHEYRPNTIIVGVPAKSIKSIYGWSMK